MYRPTNAPNYVARKSIWPAFRWLWLFFLVIPIFIMIWKIIKLRHHYYEFYDNYVIEKEGVFIKKSTKTIFPKIRTVTTRKNILGYGDVEIDVIGIHNGIEPDYRKIAHPEDLRDFLEYHMLGAAAIENISNNPYIASTEGMFGGT